MSENLVVLSVDDKYRDEGPQLRAWKKADLMQNLVVAHCRIEATQQPSAAALTDGQVRCDY